MHDMTHVMVHLHEIHVLKTKEVTKQQRLLQNVITGAMSTPSQNFHTWPKLYSGFLLSLNYLITNP